VNAVEAKTRDLEKVVEEMTLEFVGFSDVLMEGAGVNKEVGPLLRGALERFLELGKRAAKEPGEGEQVGDEEGEDSSGNETVRVMETTGISEDSTGEWQLSTDVLAEGDLPFLAPEFLPPLSLLEDDFQGLVTTAPTFNPYLNKVWQSAPTLSVPPPCEDMVPYILAGRDSFASRLYFETISLAVRSLRGDAPYHFAQAMFRFKLRYASRSQLFTLLAGVLNTLLQGTTRPGEGDAYERQNRKAAIVGELERSGAREEEF
jgi:hypothetical protein